MQWNVEPEHFRTQLVSTQIRQDQEFDTSPTSDFEAVTEEGTRYLEATYATDEEETKVETKEERRQRRTEEKEEIGRRRMKRKNTKKQMMGASYHGKNQKTTMPQPTGHTKKPQRPKTQATQPSQWLGASNFT